MSSWRDLKEIVVTIARMLTEDMEVIVEPEDVQDENDLYFGAERMEDDEEQVYAEEDQSESDSEIDESEESDSDDSGSDWDFLGDDIWILWKD